MGGRGPTGAWAAAQVRVTVETVGGVAVGGGGDDAGHATSACV